MHEVKNETGRDRLILLCDVERPLHPPMRALNRLVMHTLMAATATQNVEGEPAGALNRLYGRLDGLLQFGKRQKARDRKRHYAVKKTLVALAALGFVASVLA